MFNTFMEGTGSTTIELPLMIDEPFKYPSADFHSNPYEHIKSIKQTERFC
jgi:hypothetical protein